MNLNLLIAFLVFLIVIFLFWKVTIKEHKEETGEKMWKVWGHKTFYWHGAILISGGITYLIMYLLIWVNVLPI